MSLPARRELLASTAPPYMKARQSIVGLFPHYDEAQIERAIVHLERALDTTTDPFQRAEIAFFLAKAYLMQEDVPAARGALNQVLAQNVADYQVEAEALLRRLDTL